MMAESRTYRAYKGRMGKAAEAPTRAFSRRVEREQNFGFVSSPLSFFKLSTSNLRLDLDGSQQAQGANDSSL